ncbi:hypothetical protein AERYTH_06760 [Aeromicrobium erythreum]|jgi:hypothetical protein|uniref:Uncharacterized protein n=2 Tax=Nocardioidaceae TaxID=85015 RepID=A0A0U4C8D1_9ACTN|nr:hypothetical protein AERYTH_06760 [Aeromicrobium erythreum]
MVVPTGDESAVWARAFPARLADDVAVVVAALSAASHGTSAHTIDSPRRPRGIVVDGEVVEIPARQYHGGMDAPDRARLTSTQLGVAACIHSRHHDGRERQAWLPSLLTFDEPCASPFIVQLLGEYVVEIVTEIESTLRSGSTAASTIERLVAFMEENAPFVARTRDRARSYWWKYHTYAYATFADYPAARALDLLAGRVLGVSSEKRRT